MEGVVDAQADVAKRQRKEILAVLSLVDGQLDGIPTLHVLEPVIALVGSAVAQICAMPGTEDPQILPVTLEHNQTYYSTKAGIPLDSAKVVEGREREVANMLKHFVSSDMLRSETRTLGLKLVNAKGLMIPRL